MRRHPIDSSRLESIRHRSLPVITRRNKLRAVVATCTAFLPNMRVLLHELLEVRNKVPPIVFVPHACKNHLISRHEGRRTLEVVQQLLFCPNEPLITSLFVRVGVLKTLDGPGLAPDYSI